MWYVLKCYVITDVCVREHVTSMWMGSWSKVICSVQEAEFKKHSDIESLTFVFLTFFFFFFGIVSRRAACFSCSTLVGISCFPRGMKPGGGKGPRRVPGPTKEGGEPFFQPRTIWIFLISFVVHTKLST